MPFLRRRGVMASESDMRRHTSIFNPLSAPKLPQQQPEPPLPRPEPITTQSEPAVTLLGNPVAASSAADDLGDAVSAAGTAAAISVTEPSTPATLGNPARLPPSTPPFDGRHSSAGENTRGVVSIDSEYFSRPDSPPIQEQTPKHRRFSLLRFRNASDPQLAARARQHAQADAEAIPPMPNRKLDPVCLMGLLPLD